MKKIVISILSALAFCFGVKYSAMNIIPSGGHGWTDREFIYRKAWMNGLQAWLEGLKDALDNR